MLHLSDKNVFIPISTPPPLKHWCIVGVITGVAHLPQLELTIDDVHSERKNIVVSYDMSFAEIRKLKTECQPGYVVFIADGALETGSNCIRLFTVETTLVVPAGWEQCQELEGAISGDNDLCALCGRANRLSSEPTARCSICKVTAYDSAECQSIHWRGGHEQVCPAITRLWGVLRSDQLLSSISGPIKFSTGPPEIVILCLGGEETSAPITQFKKGAYHLCNLIVTDCSQTFTHLMSSINVSAVVVTDTDVMLPGQKPVLDLLEKFVKIQGGTVIFAGEFAQEVVPRDANAFFKRSWDLPWVVGLIVRGTHFLVSDRFHDNKQLLPAIPMKTRYLRNASPEEIIYGSHDVKSEDMALNENIAPILYTNVGKGHIGFVGDCYDGEGSKWVVMAMTKLI